MTKEEMITNLEENRASGSGVGNFTNIAYFFFGNPITDSMVVNAYAKTNSSSFLFALQNGGIYNNHTVMGGNFAYNFLYNRKFTGETLGLRNWATKISKPFEKIPILNKSKTLRNFSLNFISTKDLETTGKIVAETAEKTGLDKTSEIVRTGWGFGKNYSGFFGALKDLGYDGEAFTGVRNRTTTTVSTTKVNTGNLEINTKTNQRVNHRVNRRTGYKTKRANTTDSFKRARNRTKTFTTNVEQHVEHIVQDAKPWNAANLGDDLTKVIMNGADDKVLKLADEFVKMGGKLKNYAPGLKRVSNELREELIEQSAKFFATRTTFQKIISSPLFRVATGAAIAMPAAVSIPLIIATTAIGVVASAGQANAVNNFLNSHLYNTNQFDNYTSEEATASLYAANNIRDTNLQALYNSYAKINVANRYLNDLSPISSDYSFELEDAEII